MSEMLKGVKIAANGAAEEVEIPNGPTFLQSVYETLGVDWIEGVSWQGGRVYVDEEGRLKPDPEINLVLVWLTGQELYGNALLLGPIDPEGYDTSIDPTVAATALEVAGTFTTAKRIAEEARDGR